MSDDESIYKLIPPAVERKAKPPMHHSKFSPHTGVVGSTMGAKAKQSASLFGPPGAKKADPKKFLKKHAQEKPLPAPSKFTYADRRKEALPKPTKGSPLKRAPQKDFLRDNRMVEQSVRRTPKKEAAPEYRKKKDFGKVPSYLEKVKREVAEEEAYVEQVMASERAEAEQKSSNMRQLPEEERLMLLDALKKKWDTINRQYQQMTHMVALDTLTKCRKKEQYEADLAELERSIEKLSKTSVFVADDA